MPNHDPHSPHPSGGDGSAPSSTHHQLTDELHGRLHDALAGFADGTTVDGYASLHRSIADAIAHDHHGEHHGAHGHHDHVAGLCIAEAWHVVSDHEARPAHKVHALETALRRHAAPAGVARTEVHAG